MKKIKKSFSFNFILVSLIMIFTHYIGVDPHGIVLFGLNPILGGLRYTKFADRVINAGPHITCGSLAGYISIYWYLAHFITFALYGMVLDFVILGIKKCSRISTRA